MSAKLKKELLVQTVYIYIMLKFKIKLNVVSYPSNAKKADNKIMLLKYFFFSSNCIMLKIQDQTTCKCIMLLKFDIPKTKQTDNKIISAKNLSLTGVELDQSPENRF